MTTPTSTPTVAVDGHRGSTPRWASLVISYLLLAVSWAVPSFTGSHVDRGLLAALVAAAVVWMTWLVRLHPPTRARPVELVIYFAGLLAILTALVAVDPTFSLFGAAVYNQTFLLLTGRWLFVGFALNAVGQTVAQSGLVHQAAPPSYWLAVSIVLPMLFAGWFVGLESDRRKRTNELLADAMTENAGLHTQLLIQAREAGVQDERQRMAREIHDTLAQGLTGIITQLDAAEGDDCPAPVRDRIGKARALAKDSLTEARRSVSALPPEQLVGTRLPDALRELAARWSSSSGIVAETRVDGEPAPLVPDAEIALFRVAQEALANVAKHADAASVVLTLSYVDDVVSMDVRDDGVGFTPDPTATGVGLSTMRHRLGRVAGRLAVESTPGSGTTVNATVPAVAVEETR